VIYSMSGVLRKLIGADFVEQFGVVLDVQQLVMQAKPAEQFMEHLKVIPNDAPRGRSIHITSKGCRRGAIRFRELKGFAPMQAAFLLRVDECGRWRSGRRL
jgi:hypothetical protein